MHCALNANEPIAITSVSSRLNKAITYGDRIKPKTATTVINTVVTLTENQNAFFTLSYFFAP